MRILSCLIGLGLVFLSTASVLAKCATDALGTSRTIVLDAEKHRSFEGHEAGLGLRNKEVILTFDDGPMVGRTSRILETLEKECVKATFFYVGTMARAYPKLVRRVVRLGHTLAHHTHSHDRLPQFNSAQASKLIDRGVSRLQKIAYNDASTTPRTPFFRYPYLARTARTDRLVASKGMIAFGANIDALDWKSDSPKKVHDRIMRLVREQGKGIILMHDIQNRTVKMLPDLLRSLKKEGYRVVHMVAKKPGTQKAKPLLVASLNTPAGDGEPTGKSSLRPHLNQMPRAQGKLGPESSPAHPAKVAKTAARSRSRHKKVARRSVRKSRKPLLVASARRVSSVRRGKLRLRRSQWILR